MTGAGIAGRDVAGLAAQVGIRSVDFVTWRDLDAPDAGGSEIHATAIAGAWAAAGVDVTVRTARVPGLSRHAERDGYAVVRAGGRLSVFARTPLAELGSAADALVEVWHGVNFLAPLWWRRPLIGIAHHVHAEQFGMVLPAPLGTVARTLERRVYPRIYRRTPLVTLAESGRRELIGLGYRPDLVTVATPGVDARFTPGSGRYATPFVVAVGRLMPQKRLDVVVDVLLRLKRSQPDLSAAIVGDGPERAAITRRVASASAAPWLHVLGRVDDDDLVALYRRAWVVVSASTVEGWGMTITEAAACATPAVASRIPGHVDAVRDGETGFLVADEREMEARLGAVLGDRALRDRLGRAAAAHAAGLTWESAAATTFSVLAEAAGTRRGRRRPRHRR